MDDSIKRKIVLHESEMDLSLEWTKLQSRMENKKRRGWIFFMSTGIVAVGIITMSYLLYNQFFQYNKLPNKLDKIPAEAFAQKEDNSNLDKQMENAQIKQTLDLKDEPKIPEYSNTDNTTTSNSITILDKNPNFISQEPNNNSNTISNNKNNQQYKSKSRDVVTKANTVPIEKGLVTNQETPHQNNNSNENTRALEALGYVQTLTAFVKHDENFDLNYDFGSSKIEPLKQRINLFNNWSIESNIYGNPKSNTTIESSTSNDQNKLVRSTLEVFNTSLGLNKKISKTFSLGFGYQFQMLNEKMQAQGVGYHIQKLDNALVATGQDQAKFFAPTNQIRAINYNIVSYNNHSSHFLFVKPNLHTTILGFNFSIGAKLLRSLSSTYHYTNITEEGKATKSTKQVSHVRASSFDFNLNRNVYKNLDIGIGGEYLMSQWQYDFNTQTNEPQFIMQGTGLTKYTLNTFLLGLNMRWNL